MPRPRHQRTSRTCGHNSAAIRVLPLQDGVMLRLVQRSTTGIHRSPRRLDAVDGQAVTGPSCERPRGRRGSRCSRFLPQSQPTTDADRRRRGGAGPAGRHRRSWRRPPDPDDDRRIAARAAAPSAGAGDNSGDRVRFGGTITVNEGETVEGDVVVIGGFARVMGRVTGEVVVVGGSAELGRRPTSRGTWWSWAAGCDRDPGARIGGEVEEVGVGPININPSIDWPRWGWPGSPVGNPFGGFFSLVSTVVRVGILCLLTASCCCWAGVTWIVSARWRPPSRSRPGPSASSPRC